VTGIIYALCYREIDGSERVIYVGRTRKDLATRLEEHRRGARDPLNPKPAYEFIRASNLTDEFYAVEVCREGEFTEANIVSAARLDGHPLMNASRGDSVVPKNRGPRSQFSELNRQALARTTGNSE
jgi:hypothetical protein